MVRKLILLVCLLASSFACAELNFSTFLPEKKWALCIGVSGYSSISKLSFSGKDAVRFSEFLVSYGFNKDEIHTLSDEPGFTKPTKGNIDAKLTEILKSPDLEKGDQFIVFFSGHGVGLKDGDYWLPSDTNPADYASTAVSIKSVIKRLADAGLKSVTILSDACRAGEKNAFGNELIALGKKTNIAVLLGCEPGAKSYELRNRQQGAFTYYLTRSLQNQALADPVTGAVWVSKIGSRLKEVVAAATAGEYGSNKQIPAVYADAAQDVAFGLITTSDPDKQLSGIQSTPLDRFQRVALLSKLGREFVEKGDYTRAVECFKAVEALGDISDSTLLQYFLALSRLGRTYELERVGRRFILDRPLTNRRAAMTTLLPPRLVSSELAAKAISHLIGKFESDFDEATYIVTLMERWNLPKSEAAAFLKGKLNNSSWESTEREFAQGELARLDGKGQEAFDHHLKCLDSKLTRSDVIDAMIRDLLAEPDTGRLGTWLSLAVKTEGLSHLASYSMIEFGFAQDKANLKQYVDAAIRSRIPVLTLLKLTPRLIAEKAIEPDQMMQLLQDQPLSFESNLIKWIGENLSKSQFGGEIPESVFKYASSRVDAVSVSFSTWIELASIDLWNKDRTQEATKLRREILFQFRPYLPEILSNTDLLIAYSRELCRAGFGLEAWYWLNVQLSLNAEQKASRDLTEIRLLSALQYGDLDLVAKLKQEIETKGGLSDDLAVHLVWNYLFSDQLAPAKLIMGSLKETDPKLKTHLAMAQTYVLLKEKGKEAAASYAKSRSDEEFTMSGNLTPLSVVMTYLVEGGEPDLLVIAKILGFSPDWEDISILLIKKLQPEIAKVQDQGIAGFGKALRTKLAGFPGSNYLNEVDLEPDSKVEDFAGEYAFKLAPQYGGQVGIDILKFKVDANGIVTGTVDKWDIRGTVTKYGTFSAKLIVNGKEATAISAKLPWHKSLATDGEVSWKKAIKFLFIDNSLLLARFDATFQPKS
ncbi:MAG: caspase family protein [Fimbriimonas sp.]|nr:caspase family protein [Fimbriimonas sp.]